MNGTAELEGRYRLLLALYPAEHRRAHEDEMLGVLMTGARAGQGRPGLAEAADLIWGALRIRLRPTPHDAAGLLWRDALAVVSTVLPLIILVYLSVSALGLLGVHGALLAALARSDAESLAAWVILTACVMMRLRRIAALVAAGMLTWYAIPAADVPNWYYLAPVSMLLFVTLGLEAAVLLASPGPRRGLQILTWKGFAAALVVPAAVVFAIQRLWVLHPVATAGITTIVIFVAISGLALTSALGRRVAALLSIPGFYACVHLLVLPSTAGGPYVNVAAWEGPLRITLTCLPLAALLGVTIAITAARRVRARRDLADGPSSG
jgi:hypothetical protein